MSDDRVLRGPLLSADELVGRLERRMGSMKLIGERDDILLDAALYVARWRWMPIGDAPRVHKRMILVWWPYWKPVPFCGWWDREFNRWDGDYKTSSTDPSDPGPTHWIALPEPPR